MFKNFKGYNWLLLVVGLCYIILAIVDASEDKKDDHVVAGCEECKEKLLHVVIPVRKNAVDVDLRKDPVEGNEYE